MNDAAVPLPNEDSVSGVVERSLLEVQALSRSFMIRAGGREMDWWAVRDITLNIERGETVALVGESGCGKTTLGRLILRLLPASRGRVVFEGKDITGWSERALRPLRRRMQMVFQDPNASLNPRLTIGEALAEPLRVHGIAGKKDSEARVVALLERVGLNADAVRRYPHQFSAGQRQRVVIARALAVEPTFLVADEPTSSLDVSIQAHIINLLLDLKRDLGLTYLLILHDMNLVRLVAQRVAVMYAGRIVELGPTEAVFSAPHHPYTRALLAATPGANSPSATTLGGEPPSPLAPPAGCWFHPRCPIAEDRCRHERPRWRASAADRQVACHLAPKMPTTRDE